MIKKCISKDWKFTDFKSDYINIDLPYDYAIRKKRSADCNGTSGNGFFPDSKGKYVKFLTFDDRNHYILDIDGSYMCTEIVLNQNHLAIHPYGYTPFLVDLTPYIIKGITNKLVITTTPLQNSARWYSGNGIYRDVFLWEGGNIRIEPWDMFISTAFADEKSADIKLKFAISSDRNADIQLNFTVISNNNAVKSEIIRLKVKENIKTESEHIISLDNPLLWDLETPNIYTLKTEIYENGILCDESYNDFGIRIITADSENGLMLNGQPLKLRGGCIHHDHGVLGAAAFPAAEMRKIKLLKEAGFNAVRTAHNPPSLALLEVCDKLGMIVMDEAFDVWNKGKKDTDYHLFFGDWWARDISYMVQRDRNHPCVFSYSIGNEIYEIDGTSNATEWSMKLASEIRKYDDTRFVTSGINKGFTRRNKPENIDPDDYKTYLKDTYELPEPQDINLLTESFEAPLDIVGCNYYYSCYLFEHEYHPSRVIWGSETQAYSFYDSWELTQNNKFVLGDFTWTAIDNLGENGAGRGFWAREGSVSGELTLTSYPWRSCYQGDLDLCGYRRPQSYFREAVWIGNTEPRIFVTHPEHFGEKFSGTGWHWYDVNETWTFDDKYIGRPVKVETYTDADKIEWYINGEMKGESIPEKGIASINTIYQKGKITAVAYKQTVEVSRYSLYTTGNATSINVVAEQTGFTADNRDLCYFDISIVDDNGRIVAEAENEIYCSVDGGELLGIFSGNPCNEDQYTSNCCHAFKGRALAIIRAKKAGSVNINVYSCELASGFAEVIAK